ncbi:MAG TPA: hypothetical protein H9708_02160 [Candidatus Borkfalkia stercoripullorum]|nr:hypothetical protein [Candidatus Borkfalkia stercoripullorum]
MSVCAKTETKKIDLGKDGIGGLVVRLAVPAVVAQIINLLYNMVDRMYVSGIKDVGTDALAGLGVVFPITLIVSAFANLVGLGGAPLSGIFLGEKKERGGGKSIQRGKRSWKTKGMRKPTPFRKRS